MRRLRYSFSGFHFDWTWLLLIAGFVITLLVQLYMRSVAKKYSRVRSASGLTGAQTAERILRAAGIYDVRIAHVEGNMTDHYNPSTKILSLSDTSYGSASLTAVGVAAHECGHAIQHAQDYAPLRIRTSIVPAVNISSRLSWILFIFGILFSFTPLVWAGIILFSAAVVFQVVTLPVEVNASSRALAMLESTGTLRSDEIGGAKAVLRAAALTYVAALAASILQLLRLIAIAQRRQ